MHTKNPEECTIKYLAVKTNLLISQLNKNYKNLVVRVSEIVPDQIVIKLDNWTDTHIYIGNGPKDEESFYIVYSTNFNLCTYGILSNNFTQQLDQIFTIIN